MDFPYQVEQYWSGSQPQFWGHPPEGKDDRILMAWGFALATVGGLSKAYQAAWLGAITDLCVRKGTLQIQWRDHTSRLMFEGVIVGAYEQATNEAWTEHFEAGVELG